MHTKITIKYHYTPVRIAKSQKQNKKLPNADKNEQQGERSQTARGKGGVAQVVEYLSHKHKAWPKLQKKK
jgi:hypothetical protein